MKTKRIILLIVLLAVAGVGWYGYRLYQEKRSDIVNAKPDVSVDVTSLLNDFTKDTLAARKKYVDKIVQITGNVKSIDTSGTVVLGEDESMSVVTMGLDPRHMKDFEQLKIGSVAVMQGICTGSNNDNASADPTDLLAGLGTTVEFRSAGVKQKK